MQVLPFYIVSGTTLLVSTHIRQVWSENVLMMDCTGMILECASKHGSILKLPLLSLSRKCVEHPLEGSRENSLGDGMSVLTWQLSLRGLTLKPTGH